MNLDLSGIIESLEGIGYISDDKLLKTFNLILDPPISTLSFNDAIIGDFELPQPRLEYIEGRVIRSALGENGIDLFISIDLVISMLPLSKLESLVASDRNVILEIIREEAYTTARSLAELYRIRGEDFRSEDDVKREILILAPSSRLLDTVRGEWDKWVWRRTDRYGRESPDPKLILDDILRIGNALRDYGVKVYIATDIEHDYGDILKPYDIIPVKIPQRLAKIVYVRDQSVTWFKSPILGNMTLDFRRGEEAVLSEIYSKLNLRPLFRIRWVAEGDKLIRAYMEGGNFFVIKTEYGTAVLTGVGVRGSNYAVFKILASILPEDVRLIGVPLAGYIKDWVSGAVHLDVVFSYIGDIGGERLALVDPSRMGFYSLLEYNRREGSFKIIEMPRLMRELGVKLDEPPREGQSRITMINALNLGKGRIISDSFNELVNRYLERMYSIDVIRVDIPQLEAGGGGVRCSTRELWRD
ncbi:MAG: arginine deiminase family protein [Acidilobaceae archaeon]